MDIEKLTKSQIVLLTLLVSFVTSIATGIVTVSLVDQAPPAITQSVSRIVRETIKAPTPAGQGATAASSKTMPASEPTLSQALASASASIARVYTGSPDAPTFLGFGITLDSNGTVVADLDAVGSLDQLSAALYNATPSPMRIASRDTKNGLVYLIPVATSSTKFIPAKLAGAQPQVGDSVIAIAGKDAMRIASGLVADVSSASSTIDTSVSTGTISKGSPLVNTRGEFVGLSTGVSRSVDGATFISLSASVPHSGAPPGP